MSNRSNTNSKKPWPTKEAMEQIYEEKLWGGSDHDFYSGSGSHDPALTGPYIDKVRTFLGSFEEPLVVCDLGCGDFNVGNELVDHTKKYIAVDIVEPLIERNKERFQNENLEFRCLDIAEDKWPTGDCVILRNVLQHLSNTEIEKVVEKLSAYRYLILTEHIPEGDFEPNKDIISGQGIRIKKKSGVDLMKAPFKLKVSSKEEWLSLPAGDWPGRIVTYLIRMW